MYLEIYQYSDNDYVFKKVMYMYVEIYQDSDNDYVFKKITYVKIIEFIINNFM